MLITGDSNQVAIVTIDGNGHTYRDLMVLSKFFQDLGLERRVVLTVADNSLPSVSSIAAFIQIGAIPLLFNSKSEDSALFQILETYSVPYLFGSLERFSKVSHLRLIEIVGKEYGLFSVDLAREAITPHKELGILLTTSGSTGSPKLVRISTSNLIANANAIASYLSLSNREKPLLHLPVSYTYGLSILTSHLRVGATVLCTDESLLSRKFWDFAKENSFTSMPGVPYTYSMLKKLRFSEMDLPSLKTLTQAGGKLNAELQIEFASWAIEHQARFFIMYGQTEATARMSYLPSEFALQKIGSIGFPIPGGSFEITNTEGEEIQEVNVPGDLVYKGPNVALGYASNELDLQLGDVFAGRLKTGDSAYKDIDGFFYLIGRSDRYVKIFGNRVFLDDIEKLVSTLGVYAACVGREDSVTVFVFGNASVGAQEITKHISQRTNLNKNGFKVVFLDEPPTNLNGKIDYQKLANLMDLP